MTENIFTHPTWRCSRIEHGPYQVDKSLNVVICGTCKKELNPIWVLDQLSRLEGKYRALCDAHNKERSEANLKSKTKCEHCLKITRIKVRIRA